jgi:hypothetical protein
MSQMRHDPSRKKAEVEEQSINVKKDPGRK